jgi:magnesium chelatase family protein
MLCKAIMIGELALDGSVRPVNGALAASIMARKHGFRFIFVPPENAPEAAAVPGITVFPVPTLLSAVEHLKGVARLKAMKKRPWCKERNPAAVDLKDICGQEHAKRGLEIAAAGNHNLLLKGPPGTGKTLLARAIPGLLPLLTHEESLEVTSIASVAGALPPGTGLVTTKPFRTPHHSCSAVALIGGGSNPKPGEVSLAHRGVLFLDEFPEFSRHVLEHLRQPLEDGEVSVARAAASIRYPARFQLVAAMNPCPCGFATDPKRGCTCTPASLQRYTRRLSGPLLDRFDVILDVPNVEVQKLLEHRPSEASKDVRTRVEAAREQQLTRFHASSYLTNAEIPPAHVQTWCALNEEGKQLLLLAANKHHLSARAMSRVRKVARTIADLAGSDAIAPTHVAEALQFRLDES